MSPARIKLFTLQGYDLNSLTEPIDPSQGTYRDKPQIAAAQRKLNERLANRQVIWMSQESPDLLTSEIGRFIHEIDTDWRDVVTVVDGLIWNHIIGNDPRYIPTPEYCELRVKAAQSFHGDYESCLRAIEDEYLKMRLPCDLWEGLCRGELLYPSDQVLVEFPFQHSQIVTVQEVTSESANGRPLGAAPRRRDRTRTPSAAKLN